MEFGYNFADPFFLDGDRYTQYTTNDFQNSVLRFGIDDLHQMNVVVDEMRTADGHLPMFPDDESVEYDCDGWYNFYVVIEKTGDYEYTATIEANVVSESADDNEQTYTFTLSDEAQKNVINRIDALCWRYFGADLAMTFDRFEYGDEDDVEYVYLDEEQ